MTDSRTVIITGACGGIGGALTKEFKKSGYFVVATDAQSHPADGMVCDYYVSADLEKTATDADFSSSVFDEIRNNCPKGSIQALVNNAAIQVLGGVNSLTGEDWQKTFNINLIAPFIWSQAFLDDLEVNRGSIINISSIHARLTKRNFVAYATSKAALSGLTRAMAVDLGASVRVNAIEPAAIATEMLKAGFDNSLDSFRQLQECHPSMKIGEPMEIANLAIFLASDKAKFIHGSCVDVGGGISSRLYDPE